MATQIPQTIQDYLTIGCMRYAYGGTAACKVMAWQDPLKALLAIVSATPLQARIKWGVPCFTYANKNVVLVSALKDHLVISFINGYRLSDPAQKLLPPGPNAQYDRIIRYQSVAAIQADTEYIHQLVSESIQIIKHKKADDIKPTTPEMPLPTELLQAF